VQGVLWDVNSFDQWGVQLGKLLAAELAPAVGGEAVISPPAVTGALRALRGFRTQK
jgi:glucose-6-phosphate isomerase